MLSDGVKNDLFRIAAGIILAGAVLRVLFVSDIAVIARLVWGIIWLFVLPGYFIMLPWRNEFDLKERVVVGMLASAGLLAIASYYAGIFGLHIRTHATFLPAIVIIASVVLSLGKRFMKRLQTTRGL